MNEYMELLSRLQTVLPSENVSDTLNQETTIEGVTILKLRDAFLTIGEILEEDLENRVYIASVKTGFWNLGCAYIAAQLKDKQIFTSIYSHEGLIKQQLSSRAYQKLINTLKRNTI